MNLLHIASKYDKICVTWSTIDLVKKVAYYYQLQSIVLSVRLKMYLIRLRGAVIMKNKRFALPIFILITTLVAMLCGFVVKELFINSANGFTKFVELLVALGVTALSFVGLLLLDIYKGALSKVGYCVLLTTMIFITLKSSLNFVTIYLKYIDSIINKLNLIVCLLQSVTVSVHPDIVSMLLFLASVSAAILIIILITGNVELPSLRLIQFICQEFIDKSRTVISYNVSEGFLYKRVP